MHNTHYEALSFAGGQNAIKDNEIKDTDGACFR